MKKQKKIGIILAAGKGSRMECKSENKTSLSFAGKPLVSYAIDLFDKTCQEILVVVGFSAESVRNKVNKFHQKISKKISFVNQKERLGTGHALLKACQKIEENQINPDYVFLGYGDHMMFYQQETVNKLLNACQNKKSCLSLITTKVKNPFGMGRIIRDEDGIFQRITEEKNTNESEKKINEINAGFYCFSWNFLKKNISKLAKNPKTQEYYATDLVEIAKKMNLNVYALEIPYQEVGIGINTREDFQNSEKLFKHDAD
jgi:bifunctional UDP-N-acetylglucosamine pyrophosphorylase/glucosamine-1-phosphate N-acetyltransferase